MSLHSWFTPHTILQLINQRCWRAAPVEISGLRNGSDPRNLLHWSPLRVVGFNWDTSNQRLLKRKSRGDSWECTMHSSLQHFGRRRGTSPTVSSSAVDTQRSSQYHIPLHSQLLNIFWSEHFWLHVISDDSRWNLDVIRKDLARQFPWRKWKIMGRHVWSRGEGATSKWQRGRGRKKDALTERWGESSLNEDERICHWVKKKIN